MLSFFLMVWLSVLLSTLSVEALRCFQCANFEVEESQSSSIASALAGKSDPDCGVRETSRNAVICVKNEVCGSVSAEVSGTLLGGLLGSYKLKTQLRGCAPWSSHGCRSIDQSSPLIRSSLFWLAGIKEVKGDMCTCEWDMCVLCDWGISFHGICFKYWWLGLSAVGLLSVISGLAKCFCHCRC